MSTPYGTPKSASTEFIFIAQKLSKITTLAENQAITYFFDVNSLTTTKMMRDKSKNFIVSFLYCKSQSKRTITEFHG